MGVVYYSQEDSRWRNVMYSSRNDKTQTIGTSGCGPTCMAMVVSSLTDIGVLPTVACHYAVSKGFRTANSGTSWSFFNSFAKANKLECQQTASLSDAKKALASGNLVIASMGKGNFTGGGHYILFVGIQHRNDADWIEVYDPNHDNTKYGTSKLIEQGIKNDGKVTAHESVFKSQAKQYWIIRKGEEQMTTEEKKAFNSLEKQVAEQTKAINKLVEALELVGPPKWFVSEFGEKFIKDKMSDPKMTLEGWRSVAIALRAAK